MNFLCGFMWTDIFQCDSSKWKQNEGENDLQKPVEQLAEHEIENKRVIQSKSEQRREREREREQNIPLKQKRII